MQEGAHTIEDWAEAYVRSTSVAEKLEPARPPKRFSTAPAPLRIARPGRPAELVLTDHAPKTRGLRSARNRARALHTFFHHELQAAELMLWAVLAFPETPEPFRRGLVAIAMDEVRHMRIYATEIAVLGHGIGEFEVRDWFWERVPACPSPASFVAVMGLGFEAGNLEHSKTFADRFRAVGDERGARAQELVGREERSHVAFGAHWFRAFAGELTFERWRDALPPPLSPMLMRGRALDCEARRAAGFDEEFLRKLAAWEPVP